MPPSRLPETEGSSQKYRSQGRCMDPIEMPMLLAIVIRSQVALPLWHPLAYLQGPQESWLCMRDQAALQDKGQGQR